MMHTDVGELVKDADWDDRFVDIWSDSNIDWKSVRARYAVCPESRHEYRDMLWVTVIPGEPHLECPCGEQFMLTENRDR